MPVVNRIADMLPEMTGWRRHLHANPELAFEEHATSRFVVERLREIGVDDIHQGMAGTGVVALIHGNGGPAEGAGDYIDLRFRRPRGLGSAEAAVRTGRGRIG